MAQAAVHKAHRATSQPGLAASRGARVSDAGLSGGQAILPESSAGAPSGDAGARSHAVVSCGAGSDAECPGQPGAAAQWYVARSKPRAERLAAASLEARGLTAFLPEWRRRRRGHPDYVEPLFPGYLFVQSDGELDWELRARSAPNVVRLLGGEDGPEAVPDKLVAGIRERSELQVRAPFLPGQRVRLAVGPFRELDAIFDCELARDRVRVFVHMLYRLVPVIVDVGELRRPY